MGKSNADGKRRRSSAGGDNGSDGSPSKAFPASAKRRKTEDGSDNPKSSGSASPRRSARALADLSPELSPLRPKSSKKEKKKKEKKDKIKEVEKNDKKEKKRKDRKEKRKSEGRESGKGSDDGNKLSIRSSSPKSRSSMSFGEMMRAATKGEGIAKGTAKGAAEGSSSASSSSSGPTTAANWSPKKHPFLTPTTGPLPFLGAAAPLPFLSEMPEKKSLSMKTKKGKDAKGPEAWNDSWNESWKQGGAKDNSKGSAKASSSGSSKPSWNEKPERKQRSSSAGSAGGGKNGAKTQSNTAKTQTSSMSTVKMNLLDRDSVQYCLADKADAEVVRVDEGSESDANAASSSKDPNAWKWTKEEVITVTFEGHSWEDKSAGLRVLDGEVKSFQKGKLAFKLGGREVSGTL
jgi:hypothetical protein